ncbi:MAG: hypothetical protein WAM14_04620 [Candidatus Nitrosopolaris sp.]
MENKMTAPLVIRKCALCGKDIQIKNSKKYCNEKCMWNEYKQQRSRHQESRWSKKGRKNMLVAWDEKEIWSGLDQLEQMIILARVV